MDSLTLRRERIRKQINALSTTVQPEATGSHMWQQAESKQHCAEIHPLLAMCSEAEMAGLHIPECSTVEMHLHQCRPCTIEYRWLLELSLIEEQGLLLAPAQMPEFDDSFIQQDRTEHDR